MSIMTEILSTPDVFTNSTDTLMLKSVADFKTDNNHHIIIILIVIQLKMI